MLNSVRVNVSLFGNKVFADQIKMRSLGLALFSMTGVYKKEIWAQK